MDEQTTTDASVDAGGSDSIQGVAVDSNGSAIPESQPENTDQAEAVAPTTDDTAEGEKPKEPSDEDDNSKWLKAKGIDPTDPEAIAKLTKSAREAEKAMHSKAQRASELEKTMTGMSDTSAEQVADATGQDPEVLKRLQRMEVKDSIREFWDTHPEARSYEKEMAEIAVSSGLYGTPDAILNAAYAMAVSKDSKSQGAKEALQNLAQKQKAAVPQGNAVNPSGMGAESITPQNVDRLVAQNDLNWFKKNQDAINKAMAG